MKKVLILSSSPRKSGNTEALCGEFAAGARASGHEVEEIRLGEKKINYCINCDFCRKHDGECALKDDAAEVIGKALDCDVLVLATPIYFYNVSAQMKTLIDRFYAREHEFREKAEKQAYYIIANAAPTEEYQQSTVDVLDGFIKCLRTVRRAGIIRGMGAMAAGAVKDSPAMRQAYETGKMI